MKTNKFKLAVSELPDMAAVQANSMDGSPCKDARPYQAVSEIWSVNIVKSEVGVFKPYMKCKFQ